MVGITQQVVDGISIAGILVMVALGLGITFGVMKIINMAHGELIMIGAYTTYMVCTEGHMPFFVGMIASFIVTAAVGLLLEKFVMRRLYGMPMETLLATFGVSIFLQQLIRMIFGPDGKSVTSPLDGTLNAAGVTIPYYRIFIIVIAVLMILVTAYVMYKTKFGIQLRSISQNRNMCECLGINTTRVDAYTFAFGAGLAGLAGAILAPIKSVSPTMGLDYLIDSFMVVVLGGVGSLLGALFGSAITGVSNQLLTTFMGETGAKILVFLLIILVIRFKPEGLFRTERR
jgi:urea transport system permease protein